jgi:outer membrane protein assembly factor BamB
MGPVMRGRGLGVRTLLTGLLAGGLLTLAGCGGQSGRGSAAAISATAAAATRTATHATAHRSATRSARSGTPAQDWPEFGYDPQRSDAGPLDTGITAANVGQLQLRTVRLDGIADSSAIALDGVVVDGARRDVVVVTTSYGNTIAIDPATGARLWEFRARGVNRTPGNPQVTTASPVADPDLRSVYAAAPSGVIVKLSLATGRLQWSRSITFDPVHEKIASALNISGPFVVAVTGGYIGDIPPYDGHVVTIDRSTGRITHVWNSECADEHRLIRASSCPVTNTHGDNAMWGRAGAVIEPGSGRILTATGNGPFDGHTSWGDSVLELTPNASRLLHNWTPTDQAQLDAGDVDLGSASPALLPAFDGRRLAVQGGKDGKLHLLDLARLDGTTHGAGPRLGGELGETSTPGGGELLTAPAVWTHGGHTDVFVADDSGTGAYRLTDPAHPELTTVWSDATAGTSPVLAGGLLYVYDDITGALEVRRPLSGALIHSFPLPPGHWNSPIVSDGRVILPTGSYHDSAGTSALEILHLPGR